MTMEQGTENLKTQPSSDNPQEDNAIEDMKNDDVSPELCKCINNLQIDSDHIAFEDITTDKVNIQNQTEDDDYQNVEKMIYIKPRMTFQSFHLIIKMNVLLAKRQPYLLNLCQQQLMVKEAKKDNI